jgi:hypothetical protein
VVVHAVESDDGSAVAVSGFDRPISAGWGPVATFAAQIAPLIDLVAAQNEPAGVDVVEPGQILADEARVPGEAMALLQIGLDLIALRRAQFAGIQTHLA